MRAGLLPPRRVDYANGRQGNNNPEQESGRQPIDLIMQLTMREIVVVDVAQNQLLAIKVLPESDGFSDADVPAGLILEKRSVDDKAVAA